MNTIELNCPHCGATIHADDDLVSFNCPSCGCEIQMHEQPSASAARSDSTREAIKKPVQSEKHKSPIRGVVAWFLALVVIAGAGFIGTRVYTKKQISKGIESVRLLINQKGFSRAKSELGALFESHLFYKNKWETTKNALSIEIEEKEQEYLDNIKRAAPMSKKDAEKGNVDAVVTAFINAGFTNIVQESITDPNENKKAEDRGIKEISVIEDGEEKKDFKAGDALKTNAEITITYYDFSASPAAPLSANEAKNKDKDEVKKAFENASFSNVVSQIFVDQEQEVDAKGGLVDSVVGVLESVKDAVVERFSKEDMSGKVQSVSIQIGEKEIVDFKKGERFPADAKITIYYYE